MVPQQNYSQVFRNGKICAYGIEMPCCPECGRRMNVHGTYERKLRTRKYPEGIRYVLRVLDCKSCCRSHREIPDFIVPRKSYSYDYMCAVVRKELEPLDDSTKKRIVNYKNSIGLRFPLEDSHVILSVI